MAQFKKEYKFLTIGVLLGFILMLLFFYLRNGAPALYPLTSLVDFSKPLVGKSTGTGTGTGQSNTLFVISNNVELRFCQRDDCNVIAVLPYGSRVTKHGRPEANGGRYWIQVQPEGGGQIGWADQRFFNNSLSGPSTPDTSITSPGEGITNVINEPSTELGGTGMYQIYGNDVNVRNCAALNCRVLFRLDRGTPVTYLGRQAVGNGYTWVRIRIQGQEGWVFGAHVVRL